MADANEKPHMSPSQLELHGKCPEAWRRRYVEGHIIPPGIAALKGKGFHHGAEQNMRQKVDSHADLPVDDIVEMAVESFDAGTRGEYELTAEEESVGRKKVLAEAKDSLADFALAHAEWQAPDYQPIFVEQPFRIVLPHASHDLVGVIDLADNVDRVTDFKTSTKAKSQDDADGSVQLTTYAAAYKSLTGRDPAELRLDTIVQADYRTERDVKTSQRGPDDFEALAQRVSAVITAVNAGIFTPTTPGAWWCSERFCGFHRSCRFVNSNRRRSS